MFLDGVNLIAGLNENENNISSQFLVAQTNRGVKAKEF